MTHLRPNDIRKMTYGETTEIIILFWLKKRREKTLWRRKWNNVGVSAHEHYNFIAVKRNVAKRVSGSIYRVYPPPPFIDPFDNK